jgi:hypothetical protein
MKFLVNHCMQMCLPSVEASAEAKDEPDEGDQEPRQACGNNEDQLELHSIYELEDASMISNVFANLYCDEY